MSEPAKPYTASELEEVCASLSSSPNNLYNWKRLHATAQYIHDLEETVEDHRNCETLHSNQLKYIKKKDAQIRTLEQEKRVLQGRIDNLEAQVTQLENDWIEHEWQDNIP